VALRETQTTINMVQREIPEVRAIQIQSQRYWRARNQTMQRFAPRQM